MLRLPDNTQVRKNNKDIFYKKNLHHWRLFYILHRGIIPMNQGAHWE